MNRKIRLIMIMVLMLICALSLAACSLFDDMFGGNGPEQLSAPEIIGVTYSNYGEEQDKFILEWDYVDGGRDYLVEINGESIEVIEESYRVNSVFIDWAIDGTGTYNIKVKALVREDESEYYTESEFSEYTYELGAVRYEVDYYGRLTASGYTPDITKGEIIVESEVDGVPVEIIDFGGCYAVTKITIPDGIESISKGAFAGCSGLTEITLPFVGPKKTEAKEENLSTDWLSAPHFAYIFGTGEFEGSVKIYKKKGMYSYTYYIPTSLKKVTITGAGNVSSYAFEDCSTITSIEIRQGSIEQDAFIGCTGLTELNLPDMKSIDYIYFGLSSLKEITIPQSATEIPYNAFYGCSSLEQIVIPDNITKIDGNAFYNCSSLTQITIPKSVREISDSNTFGNCASLEEIIVETGNTYYRIENNCLIQNSNNVLIRGCSNSVIPDDITKIAYGAFSMTKINNVIIPNSVTIIGTSAFSYCKELKNIEVPSTITALSANAFSGCGLFDITSGVVYADTWAIGVVGSDSIEIREGTIGIADYSFDYSDITDVIIPDGLKSIGYCAFAYCDKLETINIPASIESINSSFVDCPNLSVTWHYNENVSLSAFGTSIDLSAVIFPEGIKHIPANVFKNSNLTSIDIPDSVESIGIGAFSGCNKLRNITLPFIGTSKTAVNEESLLGCIFGEVSLGGTVQYYDSSNSKRFQIPSSLTSVSITGGSLNYGAFYNCTNLSSIDLIGVSGNIGDKAFYNCTKLTNVVVPNGITTINSGTFSGCTSLVSITLPFVGKSQSATMSGETAFGYIFDTTNHGIPTSLKTVFITGDCEIKANAFKSCSKITRVTLSDDINIIGDSAFEGCIELTSINIPRNLSRIGAKAFYGCAELENVEITESSLSIIGNNAFQNCLVLNNINFEQTNIYSVGDYAFYGCKKFTLVIMPQTLSSIGKSAFSACDGLEKVIIRSYYTFIDTGVFNNCIKLSDITLPGGLETIKGSTFNGCTALNSITIPSSVTNIEYDVFRSSGLWNNTANNSVIYADKWAIGVNGSLSGVLNLRTDTVGIAVSAFAFKSITSFAMPANLKYIGNGAFGGCSSLTSLSLGSSIARIGSFAFEGTKISSVVIPSTVIYMGEAVFRDCLNLTTIYVSKLSNSSGWYSEWHIKIYVSLTNKIFHSVVWNY